LQFATIGGNTLHYKHEDRPGRPLLAFVNSLGTDFRIWNAVAADLAADFALLRYDKRGHGLSDAGTPPYAIAEHAEDLACLIDHLGADRAIVCGLSVGGLIAQALAARRPALVRALVLCCTAHKIGTAAFWTERIEAVERDGIGSIAEGILERWFTPAFRAGQPARLAGCRNMLVRQSAAGYAGTCAALRDADHTDLVASLGVPTLCLAADQDGSTPPDLVRSMAELIPGAEVAVIAGAGHIPCVEQPAALVARIRAFLRDKGLA
jgi:3-oxoadipate enol-lactonase